MKRRIVILGEFQTGKSTLVNCLLGHVVATVGRGFHTTQVPTVYHGPAMRAFRCTHAGNSAPLAEEELLSPATAVDWTDVQAVEVEYPHVLLEQIDLIDTPGLEACTHR